MPDDPRQDRRDPAPPRLDARKVVLTLVLAVIGVVAMVALFGRIAGVGRLLKAWREAEHAWLPVGVAGLVLAYAGYLLAYRDLARARGGPVLSYPVVGRVVALGFGATVVGSGAGGLAVDFWALHRAGLPVHESVRRVLALNTLEWGVLGAMAAGAGAVTLVADRDGGVAGMGLGWLVTVPVCVLAAAWVSSPRRAARLSAVPPPPPSSPDGTERLARGTRRALRVALADAIGGVVVARGILAQAPRHLAGLAGYPLYWIGNLIVLASAVRAFGGHLAIPSLVLAFASAMVASALPLPAGGSGGIEAALALTLNAAGLQIDAAVLAALAFRGITFWLPMIPALIILPTLRGLGAALDRTAQGVPPRSDPRPVEGVEAG